MAIDVAGTVGEAGWITAQELLTRVSRRTMANWVAAASSCVSGQVCWLCPTLAVTGDAMSQLRYGVARL